MPHDVIACILAGGEGKRLSPLTAQRAKPAVRFGGSYGLIDFPMWARSTPVVKPTWTCWVPSSKTHVNKSGTLPDAGAAISVPGHGACLRPHYE
jgi:hypothetical protein